MKKIKAIIKKIIFWWLFVTLAIVIIFRWINIPITSFMLQNIFTNEADFEYTWIDYENISDQLKIAAIASEDQKFPTHFGFDFQSIKHALRSNQKKGKKVYGGSTITQQVVKNLFLWPGKSYIRKGIEAYFAVLIEIFWSKERILEVYLNIAQFGNNVFGVEAASQKYYSQSAKKVTLNQASKIIVLLPQPLETRLYSPNSVTQKRIKHIKKQVNQLGGVKYLSKL